MNQRMATALIVVLLATAALRQERTPEFAATVGVYAASVVTEAGPRDVLLTLREDSTAELRMPPGDQGGQGTEKGTWIIDGSTVQLAFDGIGLGPGASGAALERREGALAGPDGPDGGRFAGMTFRRADTGAHDPAPQ